MKKHCCFVLATALVLSAGSLYAEEWNFEDATPGKLPPGWIAAKTGEGPGSVWKVIVDKTAPKGANVLAQTSSEGPRAMFNLCVAKKTNYKDIDLTVSFKAVDGRIDLGGGPMWRYQDNNNYYVARVNPKERNFRVYKVTEGRRKQLATADVNEAKGKWHTIRIVHKGNQIKCYLNGKLQLNVKDDAIIKAGMVGLWTKADAVTSFDGLRVVAASDAKD